MKIMILGGNGFIGSRLVYFLSSKCEVCSMDKYPPSVEIENVHYIVGDYFDTDFLRNVLSDVDVVIYSIGLLNPTNSKDNYRVGYEKEMSQLLTLCQMMLERKQKLIFISSGGTVYGNQEKDILDEDSPTFPINHYGGVKLCMENVIRIFALQMGMRACIARISNPYGEGQDYHKGVGFIDAVIRKALLGEEIEVWGDGEIKRDYIYIDDVCNMLYALCNYEGSQIIFNISTGVGTTQNQVLAIVSQQIGTISVKYVPARSIDVKSNILCNERICSICDIQPIELHEGIKKYINYLANK